MKMKEVRGALLAERATRATLRTEHSRSSTNTTQKNNKGGGAPEEQQQHHVAAPEVEERPPAEYEGQGLHRRESLSGTLPEEQDEVYVKPAAKKGEEKGDEAAAAAAQPESK